MTVTYQHQDVPRAVRRRRHVRMPGDLITTLGPTIAGSNVIMQLAHPKVGYGVLESRVDSGSAIKHPIKRARTTGLFLATALFGNDDDRAFVHEAVKRIHGEVYSTGDSPVRYSANDSRLQLWVAICLVKFFVDQYELLYGPLSVEERDGVVLDARWLGTTLNVHEGQWPGNYAALLEYWESQLPEMSIDPPVRQLLQDLSDLSYLKIRLGTAGTVVHKTAGGTLAFLIRGGLPPEFRTMMGWEWTSRDDKRYNTILAAFRKVDPVTNWSYRALMHAYLLDMRLRRRLGLRVF